MTAIEDDRAESDEELSANGTDQEGAGDVDDEFADEDTEVSLGDAFEDNVDTEGDETSEIEAVEELTSKELSARSLEIRRAIEERMERKQFSEEVDYLDFDDDI